MPYDVFISYSHLNKEVADAICYELEKNGTRCWYAPRDIPAGETWAGAIINAIRSCRIFVLVLSSYSNVSRQVLNEVVNAVNNGNIIIPFRLDKSEITDDMLYYLSATQWQDATTPPLQRHVEALRDQILRLLDRQAPSAAHCSGSQFQVGSISVTGVGAKPGFQLIGSDHLAVRSDGRVFTTCQNPYRESLTAGWHHIVEVSETEEYLMGLRANGTVVPAIKEDYFRVEGPYGAEKRKDLLKSLKRVSAWKNIRQIRSGYNHTIALRADGRVERIAVNRNDPCCSYVAGWKDIVSIAAYDSVSAGVKSDGTVVIAGNDYFNSWVFHDVEHWRDIIAVSVAWGYLAGLKADGTVLVTPVFKSSREADAFFRGTVQGWKNIVEIGAAREYLVALRKDGTVALALTEFGSKNRQVSFRHWTDVVRICPSRNGVFGIRNDGTVVSDDPNRECPVCTWNLLAPWHQCIDV